MEDDDARKPRTSTHRLGEALDSLSVDEFDERIAQLRAEIARLEAAKLRKRGALDAASSVFGQRPA